LFCCPVVPLSVACCSIVPLFCCCAVLRFRLFVV
jgi:hypothetical protein